MPKPEKTIGKLDLATKRKLQQHLLAMEEGLCQITFGPKDLSVHLVRDSVTNSQHGYYRDVVLSYLTYVAIGEGNKDWTDADSHRELKARFLPVTKTRIVNRSTGEVGPWHEELASTGSLNVESMSEYLDACIRWIEEYFPGSEVPIANPNWRGEPEPEWRAFLRQRKKERASAKR